MMSFESGKKPSPPPEAQRSVIAVILGFVGRCISGGYRNFMAWVDSRLPLPRFLSEHVLSFPTPMNLNYMWTFGGILSFCLFSQILTGIVLAMHYTPEITMAFASVEAITRDVQYGWLLRSLHANGASMFFVAVYIHMLRGLYYGSFKPPRDMLWILGVAIYIIMIATAFMGYVLPWGQMSYWAATVITNLFEAIPVVGVAFKEWLIGGFTIGNPTLNRFFVLHYLLPFVIVGLVGLHIWALHVVGNNNPEGIAVRKGVETVPFHPFYTIKDGFAIVIFCLLFFAFVFFMPDALGHPDNFIPADPLHTPAHIVPEWYFLPFYAILRAIPDKLMGVLALFSALGLLFALPWLDRSPVRSTKFRPMYQPLFWLFILDCLALGYLGAQEPQGWFLLASRVATFWYFFHLCVVLPFFPMIEKTKPLPKGIGMRMRS